MESAAAAAVAVAATAAATVAGAELGEQAATIEGVQRVSGGQVEGAGGGSKCAGVTLITMGWGGRINWQRTHAQSRITL